MVERIDECEHMANRRQKDVTARVGGLGLEREREIVASRANVLAEKIDRIAEPLDRLLRIFRGVGLHSFSTAPEHVRLSAELRAEVDRVHGLLQRVVADPGVVARESAVAKYRIAEEIGRRLSHFPPR